MKIYFKVLLFIFNSTFLLLNFSAVAQSGCTDPLANNFDPLATVNDGSCLYNPAAISPLTSTILSPALNETSGIILWNNQLLTHLDSGNTANLYTIEINDLSNFNTIDLSGLINTDWEDIAQDEDYIYIGDFGNNANGNRTNLKIYRIEKASLALPIAVVDEINFSYADQIDLSPQGGNNTDFDCEAMIVADNTIYLFTKEWVSQQTTIYALPNTLGTHSAVNQGSLNVNGLITGATYLDDKQLVVLSGYSAILQPFVYLLYDFPNNDFFGGNKRKINLNLPFHQVEGIDSVDGFNYFITNERLSQFLTIQPQVHKLDLTNFLLDYLGYETSVNAGLFSDPSSWISGFVPLPNSDIIISHDLILLDQDFTADSVLVKHNSVFTISMTNQLEAKYFQVNDNSFITVHNDHNLKKLD